jgi:uncharacterized protein YebE (UPF0316 family)
MLSLALYIFVLRVLDISAATLRLTMVMRGIKSAAWFFGFFQALLYIMAIQAVLANLDNWLNILAYATGFATGTLMGITLEGRLALGYIHLRVISSHRGSELAEHLRGKGFAVTEVRGMGKDGMVTILNCIVKRKEVDQVEMLVKEKDEQAFITADPVRSVKRGFLRN